MLLGEDLTPTSTSPLSASSPLQVDLQPASCCWKGGCGAGNHPLFFFFSSWEFLRFIREKHSDRYQLHEAGANNERTQRWLGSAGEALRGGCSLAISSTSAELRDCCDVVHQLKIKLHDFAKLTTSSSTPFETLH